MEILYALAGIRNPFGNTVLSALTWLGSEIAAVAIPLIVYWCVRKRDGYFILANVLFGTTVNQTIKFFCRVPRPFVRDPEFKIVESARAEATGYSFPSGHTHNAGAIFGGIAAIWKNKAARIACALIILVVGFSRVYLGVHYLSDVLFGLGCALIILALTGVLFRAIDRNPSLLPLSCGIGAAVALVLALVLEFVPWGGDLDRANWQDAVKALNLCFGCMLSVALFEPIERKKIRFDTKAVWWAQVLKVVLGLALIMGLRVGLKPLLVALFGDLGIGNAIRYFLIASFALVVWPLTFPFFGKLGRSGGKA